MVVEINLLPKEKAVSKTTQRAVTILNKLALGLTVVFLIVAVAGGAVYFLMTTTLSNLKKEQETVTANIQSLQSTEASLILLKDRIEKIQGILSSRTTEEAFNKQKRILSYELDSVAFESSEMGSGISKLELAVGNSRDLLTLFSNLMIQSNYSSLILSELNFNQNTGYNVELEVN